MEAVGCAVGRIRHVGGSVSRSDSGVRKVFTRPRRVYVGGERFSDDGHLKYYVRCGGKAVEEKKRMKLVRNLSRDLSLLMRMEECGEGLIGDNREKETMEVLLAQLEQLRSKEKLVKKEKEEEKAMKKMMKKKNKEEKAMKKMKDCKDDMSSSSSSESSESSDSECDEVVDSATLRTGMLMENAQATPCDLVISAKKDENNIVQVSAKDSMAGAEALLPSAKIEVCMGGKCKKSGALQLIEEFEKIVGNEDTAVVGCKCMGKCKEGPNVRIVNQCGDGEVLEPSPRNPLCIGVGLDDVGAIISNYLRKKDMGLMAA